VCEHQYACCADPVEFECIVVRRTRANANRVDKTWSEEALTNANQILQFGFLTFASALKHRRFFLHGPVSQLAPQPFKLDPDLRFPDSLFSVLGHAQRIPSCEGCIFVVQATQLPKQEESLHVCETVPQFRPEPLKFFLGSKRRVLMICCLTACRESSPGFFEPLCQGRWYPLRGFSLRQHPPERLQTLPHFAHRHDRGSMVTFGLSFAEEFMPEWSEPLK